MLNIVDNYSDDDDVDYDNHVTSFFGRVFSSYETPSLCIYNAPYILYNIFYLLIYYNHADFCVK